MNKELYGVAVSNSYNDTRRMSVEERWLRLTARKHSIRGASKYRGVSIFKKEDEKPWQATLAYNGKRYRAGVFSTEEEAAIAWNKMALRIIGPAAIHRLNIVPGHHES
jgi:hypothetical protein